MSDYPHNVPESKVGGTFASGVSVRHSKWAFVLDFLVHDDRPGHDGFLVVERLRLDPSCVQQMLSILSQQLNEYDVEFGDPRGLTPPGGAPAD